MKKIFSLLLAGVMAIGMMVPVAASGFDITDYQGNFTVQLKPYDTQGIQYHEGPNPSVPSWPIVNDWDTVRQEQYVSGSATVQENRIDLTVNTDQSTYNIELSIDEYGTVLADRVNAFVNDKNWGLNSSTYVESENSFSIHIPIIAVSDNTANRTVLIYFNGSFEFTKQACPYKTIPDGRYDFHQWDFGENGPYLTVYPRVKANGNIDWCYVTRETVEYVDISSEACITTFEIKTDMDTHIMKVRMLDDSNFQILEIDGVQNNDTSNTYVAYNAHGVNDTMLCGDLLAHDGNGGILLFALGWLSLVPRA